MADVPGKSIRVLILDGTQTIIARLKTKGMTINNEPVDVTTDDDHPWRTLLAAASIKSIEVTASGVVSDAATLATLTTLAMHLTDTTTTCTFQDGSGGSTEQIEGVFQLTNFEKTGATDGAGEFSCTFQSSAAQVLSAAT